MYRNLPHKTFTALALASLLTLLMIPFALAAPAKPAGLDAPDAQPVKVTFQTSGLPAGISLTITGSHTNPGGHFPLPYSTTFTSPGPSANIASEANTDFSYSGFPENITSGGDVYSLLSATPSSPIPLGDSGNDTTVVASYEVCSIITITSQPTDVIAELGSQATFSVAVTGLLPTYQWRRNGMDITGANSSSYTILAVDWSNNGDTYDVVISNGCSAETSDAASLTVTKKSQTIDFPQPASPQFYQATFGVSATATSGLTVGFSVSGGCSLIGTTVTMTSGTDACVITASQDGNSDFLAAPNVPQTVNASKLGQTITFAQPASPASYGSQFTVNPTASSGLVVTLAASGGCTNTGFDVTMTSGTVACTLTASQAGNDNYLAAVDVIRTVTASKLGQTITFAQPTSPVEVGSTFDISPTSDSGLTVSVTAGGACSLTGNTVTASNSPGTCTLTASQVGNEFYNAAAEVARTVEVMVSVNKIYLPTIYR